MNNNYKHNRLSSRQLIYGWPCIGFWLDVMNRGSPSTQCIYNHIYICRVSCGKRAVLFEDKIRTKIIKLAEISWCNNWYRSIVTIQIDFLVPMSTVNSSNFNKQSRTCSVRSEWKIWLGNLNGHQAYDGSIEIY